MDGVRVGCWLGSLTLSTRQPPHSKGPLWGQQATLMPLPHLPVRALMEPWVTLFAGDGTQSRLHARQALSLVHTTSFCILH